MATEKCRPNPEYLIKSIAEQGYSLETSIADLIDNSISAAARKIEILIDSQKKPFQLFITDDGNGMTEKELKKNMNFPSSSMEDHRDVEDLGRFGLGLKTASFAQTRCFTVISRKIGTKKYSARTWDVNHLKKAGDWEILINTQKEITDLLAIYRSLSNNFLNSFSKYTPNTIIIWNGLYKFEKNHLSDDDSDNLQKELTEVTKEYLQLIFHRFFENKNPLSIRINNEQLKPFNPFPTGARNIPTQQKLLLGNKLKLEGYVLPNRSIEESKGSSEWTLPHKGLMDMEGVYIYRANRIIVFGGWNNLIRKSPRLQLARLKVEIGNGIDDLFHLNVAKSSIVIPHSERFAFIRYVSDLKTEAEKEYYNHTRKGDALKSTLKSVFKKVPTSAGMVLEIDNDFPLINAFYSSLNQKQKKDLSLIFRMITTTINKIKKVHVDSNYVTLVEEDRIEDASMYRAISTLLESGVSKKDILIHIIPSFGIPENSLPNSIRSLLL